MGSGPQGITQLDFWGVCLEDSPLKDVTRRQRSTLVSIPRRCRHKQKRKTCGDIVIDQPRHQVRLNVWEQDALVRSSKWEKQQLGTREKHKHFCCWRKTPRKRNFTAALLTSLVHVLEGQTFPGAQTTLWASCVNFLQASIKLSSPDSSLSLQMIPKLIFCYRAIFLSSIRQNRKNNQ